MFYSPSPTSKRLPTSTDQLNRYLPNMDQSQSQKQQSLYTKFSTVDQIAKSIDIEKEKFDEENQIFYEKINQFSNIVMKGKKDCSELKHKIELIKFGDYSQPDHLTPLEQLPSFPLQSIFYTLNQKHKSSSSLQKEEIHILASEIQKLEKQSAKLYCKETQKFDSFQQRLFAEFDKISQRLTKNTNKSDQTLLELKIIKDHENLLSKIQRWQTQMNQHFGDKILKLIEKVQNAE